jgi:DNA invertase Pin-like site-specific DNA recombinase
MRVRIIQPKPKVERKKRVCAYARVSTESDIQGESLENQVTTYQNLISSNPEYEFVDVFADRGFTGTTENRPEFQRMLQMCREEKIDLIITKSVSRFARNTTIVLQTVRELKDIGVEVKFEQENVSTMSGDGELMLSVLSSFAEEESRSTSENMKWRIKKKFEKGELITTIHPSIDTTFDVMKVGSGVLHDLMSTHPATKAIALTNDAVFNISVSSIAQRKSFGQSVVEWVGGIAAGGGSTRW